MAESKLERLDSIIDQALRSTSGLEAMSLVSIDGLVITSILPTGIEDEQIAAVTAEILALGERTTREMNRGNLKQIYIRGSRGYVIITAAGELAVLTAIVSGEAKLGLLFVSLENTAQQIEAVLKE